MNKKATSKAKKKAVTKTAPKAAKSVKSAKAKPAVKKAVSKTAAKATVKKAAVKKTASKVKKAVKAVKSAKKNSMMVQHLFKLQGMYRTPDGKVLKVVVSEVYNLRCFEIINGKMVGPMIKIHPASDLAKSLVEVTN